MENTLQNLYLIRAIEAYPNELEKAAEALNYALSYDPNNTKALCLMAKLQNEQLGNFHLAKQYFERAIACDMDNPDIYPDFIRLLVNHANYTEAEKLIDFALGFNGTTKANVLLAQASLFEAKREYDDAEKVLQEAKLIALNSEFMNYVDSTINRIITKRNIVKFKSRTNETVEKNEVKTTNSNWLRNRLNNLL